MEMIDNFEKYYNISDNIKKILNGKTKTYPVDIEGICKELGISVEYDLLYPDNHVNFWTSVSGKIVKQKTNKNEQESFTIIVQETEPPVRQRFTIAHELAHFILHKDIIGDGITEDTLYRSKNKQMNQQRETEANYLAADILMPFSLINTLQKKYDPVLEEDDLPEYSFKEIASALQVSSLALQIRIGGVE